MSISNSGAAPATVDELVISTATVPCAWEGEIARNCNILSSTREPGDRPKTCIDTYRGGRL